MPHPVMSEKPVMSVKDVYSIFRPQLTPKEMLELGVFGGWYFEGDIAEYPAEWFEKAKLSPDGFDASLNRFGVATGQSRQEWQAKGWITPEDPLGWFQWYCRFTMGRRLPGVDFFQIMRWPDHALESLWPAPYRRNPGQLRAGRHFLPAPPAPGPAAMGLRPFHLRGPASERRRHLRGAGMARARDRSGALTPDRGGSL